MSTADPRPSPSGGGVSALASLLAQDERDPAPALEAGRKAWGRIIKQGRTAAPRADWASVGRACALFGASPAATLEQQIGAAGFAGLDTEDHETAARAFSASFAPPRDTAPAALTSASDRLLWLGHFDPDSLLDALLRLRPVTARREWWRLLGLNWVRFEVAPAREEEMRQLIREADPADRAAMMTPLERHQLAQLPEAFTVHRGCYADESGGLSWSLCPAIAAKFPFIERYRRADDTPLLLTAQVKRDACVLLLCRGELEVIATDPEGVTAKDLTGHSPQARPWVYVDDPDTGLPWRA